MALRVNDLVLGLTLMLLTLAGLCALVLLVLGHVVDERSRR